MYTDIEKRRAKDRELYQKHRKAKLNRNAEWKKLNAGKVKLQRADYRKRTTAERNAYKAYYRAIKLQRTPAWANLESIKQIYRLSKEISLNTGVKHEVDHIIPLQGELVCGLHVENNLQIITTFENRSKFNLFHTK